MIRLRNYELERIWKEAVVALLEALSQSFPGGAEENHDITVGSELTTSRIPPVSGK
jgi:hypothetical protein